MSLRNAVLLILCCALLGGLSAFNVRPAWAGNNQNQNKAKQAAKRADQAAAKRDAERAAQMARLMGALSAEARARVTQLNEEIQQLEKSVRDATAALSKSEDDLIDSQTPDSDFGKARDAYRVAKGKYDTALASAGDSENPAGDSDQSADDEEPARTARRKVARAKIDFDAATEAYEKAKKKLLQADPGWTAADNELTQEQKALDKANFDFQRALGIITESQRDSGASGLPGTPSSNSNPKSGSSSKGGGKKGRK